VHKGKSMVKKVHNKMC